MAKLIKYAFYIAVIGFLIYKYGIPFYKTYNAKEESIQLYNSLKNDPLGWEKFDTSTKGNAIYLKSFGEGEEVTVIFAVFHGDEPGGLHLAVQLARYLEQNPALLKQKVVIVPALNPDGLYEGTRTNSGGVDINRNFPTRNWSPVYNDDDVYPGREPASEKETQIALQILELYKPVKIISIHSALHVVNYDGPAQGLANEMARYNGYDVSADIGYATPGSFGTYAGKELNIPTVTLELPVYDPEQAWLDNRDALIAAINF